MPALSALLAVLVTLLYCVVAFLLGVFTPDSQAVAQVPLWVRVIAFAWFTFAYMFFCSFYIYFVVDDVAAKLRLRLGGRGPSPTPPATASSSF